MQKDFDAFPCSSHDIHVTLSRTCKYMSFNLHVSCLNVILTNSMQNFNFCLTALPCLLSRDEVLLITKTKAFVKHTTLIDKYINKRKLMLEYQHC